MSSEPNEIKKSQPSGLEKELWYRFQVQEQQETPKRLEEAAKFLVTIISISLTLFLAITGKDNIAKNITCGFLIMMVCWFLSILGAFFVLFPFRYKYSQLQVQSYIDAHKNIVKTKRRILLISLLFYILALLILACQCY